MARAMLRDSVRYRDAASGFFGAKGAASITVREPGTATAIAQTMRDAVTGGNVLTNPLTADANGEFEFYLDTAQRVDLLVSAAGFSPVTIPNVPVLHSPVDIVTLTGTQTLTNKTLVDPTVTDGDFTDPVLHNAVLDGTVTLNGAPAVGGQTLFADGLIASPGVAYIADTDTGLRRVSADYQALTVGGEDAIRMKNGTKFPQIGIGNVDEPGPGGEANIFHLHYQNTGAEGDVIGIVSEITANAASGGAGSIPDSSAISAIIYQTTDASEGAIRALEAHAIRSHVGAGSHANATAMALEAGIHSAAAGDGVSKTVALHIGSYDASGMTAVVADTAVYVWGARGFTNSALFKDIAHATVFQVSGDQGLVRSGTAGNAGAPTYSFVGDTNLGIYRIGADILGFATAGGERARITAAGVLELAEGLKVDTSKPWGFNGVTPSNTQSGWAPTGGSAARGGDVSTLTTAQLGNLIWTMVQDLVTKGVLAA